MNVHILVTADDPELLSSTTLFLDTIKIGFPTWNIIVWDNNSKVVWYNNQPRSFIYMPIQHRVHHADWIQARIETEVEPFVIVDPDTIFWDNLEPHLRKCVHRGIHGIGIPEIWNEWSQTPSASRLHTCFMWVPDPQYVRLRILNWAGDKPPTEYRPYNLYRPQLLPDLTGIIFYDTCALLSKVVMGYTLSSEIMDCFDHINSASFYKEMLALVDRPEGFALIHKWAKENPTRLKGLWKEIEHYYKRMHDKL